jgi:hypothetical protein
VRPDDPASLRKSMLELLDMTRVKIEEGQCESLALLIVGPDPEVAGDDAYSGSRFLVCARHLDLVDDLYRQMIGILSERYGVTPEEIRARRGK